MDETYILVRGQWKYLYRAVDKAGHTIGFMPRAQRDKAAAPRFFEKAIAHHGQPDSVTIDGSPANLAALHDINAEREAPIAIRQVKYLNNIVEQDHRPSSADSTDAGIQGLSLRASLPVNRIALQRTDCSLRGTASGPWQSCA